MRTALLLACLALSTTIWAQPYFTGRRSFVFTDAGRSNRAVNTELYYPAASTGLNAPLATGTEKFPVVVFGHGFLMPATAYAWLADSLVKYGYVVAFPTTESTLAPSHEQFGRDIAFLCQRITSLNDSSASFLFGRVMNRSAAGGHSMGGGCSFLAMTYQPGINALFNFAAAETNPSAKTAALSVQKPALVFSGSGDCIVAPSVQQEMYNNVPYPCKTRINITGALHCQFGNNDATCVLGQISSGCNGSSITPSVVFQKTCSLLVPFLNHYLKSDCNARQLFESNYAALAGAEKERTCSSDPAGCVVTGIGNGPSASPLRLFPNPLPAGQMLTVAFPFTGKQQLRVYDASGKLVFSRTGIRGGRFQLTLRLPGHYVVEISSGEAPLHTSLLVQ